ncbi:hypothetical protein CXB51_022018 [Gossypium anomalum]|uniref:Gag-pol polyprotein n=1 Tax=Gossypium anomalum TaxID=47600 RepID=A0A8J6CUR3_9ROSI|nr:hypothetical protein CXB51_022018 [Gossypium anomalum]
METIREGSFIIRAPLLVGSSNYGCWKAQKVAQVSSKALYAIFNGVDMEQFKMISTCEIAKKAWIILQNQHEGNVFVKMPKLQILAIEFVSLKMDEDETISNFYIRLCDIYDEVFCLGEHFSKVKLVRKVLHSLLERFVIKVTVIEEANDITTLRLDELISSLRTFE